MHEARQLLPGVEMCEDAYAAIKDADAAVILTEWNEFRGLDPGRMKAALRQPVVVDLRNIYAPKDMMAAGFRYSCVGRPVTADGSSGD
jgi:UDPglucose 6-dehydrogenase